ncbi:hypothetical protein L9F63_012420, partial [Diploptera punctata]
LLYNCRLSVGMFVNNEVMSNETNLSEGSISTFSNFSTNCHFDMLYVVLPSMVEFMNFEINTFKIINSFKLIIQPFRNFVSWFVNFWKSMYIRVSWVK